MFESVLTTGAIAIAGIFALLIVIAVSKQIYKAVRANDEPINQSEYDDFDSFLQSIKGDKEAKKSAMETLKDTQVSGGEAMMHEASQVIEIKRNGDCKMLTEHGRVIGLTGKGIDWKIEEFAILTYMLLANKSMIDILYMSPYLQFRGVSAIKTKCWRLKKVFEGGNGTALEHEIYNRTKGDITLARLEMMRAAKALNIPASVVKDSIQ